MDIHWTGPCLASQSVEDGVGLEDAVVFEDICHTGIRPRGNFSICGGGRGVDSLQFSV